MISLESILCIRNASSSTASNSIYLSLARSGSILSSRHKHHGPAGSGTGPQKPSGALKYRRRWRRRKSTTDGLRTSSSAASINGGLLFIYFYLPKLLFFIIFQLFLRILLYDSLLSLGSYPHPQLLSSRDD